MSSSQDNRNFALHFGNPIANQNAQHFNEHVDFAPYSSPNTYRSPSIDATTSSSSNYHSQNRTPSRGYQTGRRTFRPYQRGFNNFRGGPKRQHFQGDKLINNDGDISCYINFEMLQDPWEHLMKKRSAVIANNLIAADSETTQNLRQKDCQAYAKTNEAVE
uniref:Uncharacterized protein n=1 Tax=Romanomermis culicivorax TaxID=13658 RepID=A0A915KTD1_ROMCU